MQILFFDLFNFGLRLAIFDMMRSQELHKRRMQIKANSKIHKKPKGKALFLSLPFISWPVRLKSSKLKCSEQEFSE